MATQREEILYSGHGVTITNSHAIVDGRTYSFRDTHSASLDTATGWKPYGWTALLLGLGIAIAGYFAWGTLLPPIIGGIALAIGGIALIAMSPRRYFVKIRSNEGDIVSIPVTNRDSAHQIIAAVDQARPA